MWLIPLSITGIVLLLAGWINKQAGSGPADASLKVIVWLIAIVVIGISWLTYALV